MEISCPRCESAFSADIKSLRQHHFQVKCSVCQQVFHVDLAAETETAGKHLGHRFSRYLLITIITLLLLALIGQIVLSTGVYSYAANSAPVRQAMIRGATALGTTIPWPGPNKAIQIIDSQVTPVGDHLAMITGQIENLAGHVQAYPVIEVTLSNVYGAPITHLHFNPSQYLGPHHKTIDGFLAHSPIHFTLHSPQLAAAAGYQVTLLSRP
ncbi:MAG: zinc-ribbon and DUF3426 domain-containing protein [Acidithiobacillus sp.]